MCAKQNEQSSNHWCHLISEINGLAACVTPLLKILIMAAAAWQLINENDVAAAAWQLVFNALCHCQAILVLLLHELVVVTCLAVRAVLQQMHWAHENLGACCGLVSEDRGCAP